MPRITFNARSVLKTGYSAYHCTKCRKNFKGVDRTKRHHERTGHDGFTRKFVSHVLKNDNPS